MLLFNEYVIDLVLLWDFSEKNFKVEYINDLWILSYVNIIENECY